MSNTSDSGICISQVLEIHLRELMRQQSTIFLVYNLFDVSGDGMESRGAKHNDNDNTTQYTIPCDLAGCWRLVFLVHSSQIIFTIIYLF